MPLDKLKPIGMRLINEFGNGCNVQGAAAGEVAVEPPPCGLLLRCTINSFLINFPGRQFLHVFAVQTICS